MTRYHVTCTDYRRLRLVIDGVPDVKEVHPSPRAHLVGSGPDCYYMYHAIVDAPDGWQPLTMRSPLRDAAFGVGGEDRGVDASEVPADYTARNLDFTLGRS